MVCIQRIVLDVLKPHHPSALEFAEALAGVGSDYHVRLTVMEIDANTETLQIEVSAPAINFERVQAAITAMSGSLHSIDEVEVRSLPEHD